MPNRGQTCSAPCTEYPLSVHLEPPRHWIIGATASLTPTPYTSTRQSVLQKSCSFNCISQQVCHSTFSQNFSSSFPNCCKLCHFTFSSLPLPPPHLAAPAPLLSPLCYHASPLLFLDLHVLLVEDLSCFPHLHNHQPHPLDLWTHHLCPEKKSDINLIA